MNFSVKGLTDFSAWQLAVITVLIMLVVYASNNRVFLLGSSVRQFIG